MTKKSRIASGAMLIALFSQLYLDLLIPDFRVSCGVIAIAIFIYSNRDINGSTIGFASALSTFFWRIAVLVALDTYSPAIILGYIPEIFFYMGYGAVMELTLQRRGMYSLDQFFILAVVCDWGMNIIEVLIRVIWFKQVFFSDILTTLLFVAVIRSVIVLISVIVLRYQKNLLLREEHAARYKKLLWLNVFIRTEVYWMESSMDRVEEVMTRAYGHFEDLRDEKNKDNWASDAVAIAGAVHEIKKEYELVIRGVNDLMENKYQNNTMTFHSIAAILEEQMQLEAFEKKINARLILDYGPDFDTLQHFQLMSILRNLITNALDAAQTSEKVVTIRMAHWVEGDSHRFRITDDGPGIDQESLPIINTPGFSTKIDYETGHINRGLGLTIVYKYVQDEFKGTVTAKSIPYKRTSFDISIPKNQIEVFQ